MRFKLIACDVLTREVCYCVARAPHTIDLLFTPKGEHNDADGLRTLLQELIDEADRMHPGYDAILLAFGLCGNSVIGLEAPSCPLVIPRAHDCTTLFLGSKEAFRSHFGDNPSQAWASVGYAERGDTIIADNSARDHLGAGQTHEELIAMYGEENAAYLLETLRTEHGSDKLYLLDVPETRSEEVLKDIRCRATEQGLHLEVLPGSLRLIKDLVYGEWSVDDFLVVPPKHRIAGIYDMDTIVEAVAPDQQT